MLLLKGQNHKKLDQNSLHQYNHFSNIEMTGIPDSITKKKFRKCSN